MVVMGGLRIWAKFQGPYGGDIIGGSLYLGGALYLGG